MKLPFALWTREAARLDRVAGLLLSCHMITTVTNRGALRFMVYRKRFTTGVFFEFPRRLIRGGQRKIYLPVLSHLLLPG